MRGAKRVTAGIMAMLLCIAASSCAGGGQTPAQNAHITVRLAAPQNNNIQDFETNSYKLWLEEKTGLNIEMTWLPPEDAENIARQALASGEGLPDAYIGFGAGFGTNFERDSVFSNLNLIRYGERGVIIPLDDLIEQCGVNTKQVFADYPDTRLREGMTLADGHIYAMPGYSTSIIKRYRPLMYVNKGWLDALGLDTPATTGEFHAMLTAFATRDPNGNGLADEIPLAGTEKFYSKQPYDYLFNAFIYNDDKNTRLYPVNGKLTFAPTRDEWRDALIYMRTLFEEGLYSPLSFTQSDQQMRQMANDPRDILGAFTVSGIQYNVLQNSPEIMARYVGIGPLKGPDGAQFATVNVPLPRPNGIITSACAHPEEVFRLFDLMLSEEASLLSRYGEKGVDWDYATDGEMSIFDTPATIKIVNQLWRVPQNKHLTHIEPYFMRPEHSSGTSRPDGGVDGEYVTAQTAMLYQAHDPPEYIGVLMFTQEEEASIVETRAAIEQHVKDTIRDFITGARDIRDDAEWAATLAEFDALGLQKLMRVMQTAYDRSPSA